MFDVESNRDGLQREFDRIRRKAPREIERGLGAIGQDALNELRSITPVDTGKLIRSLRVDVIREGVEVGSPLDYAEYVLRRPIEHVLSNISRRTDRELSRMGDRILGAR